MLRWISRGVTWPFSSPPPPFHQHNPQWSDAKLTYWNDHLLPKMLQEGAIRQLSGPTPYVSPSRLEAKASGGFRHVVDLRQLNKHVPVPRTKYKTLGLLPQLSEAGDVAISLDMQSGYYCLGIHPDYQ